TNIYFRTNPHRRRTVATTLSGKRQSESWRNPVLWTSPASRTSKSGRNVHSCWRRSRRISSERRSAVWRKRDELICQGHPFRLDRRTEQSDGCFRTDVGYARNRVRKRRRKGQRHRTFGFAAAHIK